MKRTLLILLFFFSIVTVHAQPKIPVRPKALTKGLPDVDTIIVRNLKFKISTWNWLKAENSGSNYVKLTSAKKINAKAKGMKSASTETMLTIDSMPGKEVMDFYRAVNRASAGVVKNIYKEVVDEIRKKKNLSLLIKQYDDRMEYEFKITESRGATL